jgi:hypothetical protein
MAFEGRLPADVIACRWGEISASYSRVLQYIARGSNLLMYSLMIDGRYRLKNSRLKVANAIDHVDGELQEQYDDMA